MSTITLDFRYAYNQGERRTADPTTYQWDKGHTLDIIVPTAVQSAELHYHKSGDDKAKPFAPNSIEGNTVHANIPNSLFEDSRDIIVYLVVTDDEMYRTEYEGVIDIRARPKPYDYTEDNPENGAQTISGLYAEAKEAVAKAGEAVAKAGEAKTSAAEAKTSETNAKTSEGNAASSAASASDSAESAASSASEAKASADSVKASADTIQTNSDDIGNLKNQIDAANEKIDTMTKMLSVTGASRANSFIYEYNLGTSFTNEQSADIVAGTFDKVRPGGYWTINGHKYWAGHADYRLHCGDTELTEHHMLVFPDKSFYNHVMNSTNVTTGAYYGSNMVSAGLADALATVKADFGESHVLTYRNLLANAVSGGSSSSMAWYDRQIDLMNECMVYGHQVWGAAAHNSYDVGCDKSQIALFQARPDLIVNRQNWWLRDVQSSTGFCGVAYPGNASGWNASSVFGVRPAFLIA